MRTVTGAVIIIAGLMLLATPRYIFPVCGMGKKPPEKTTEEIKHKCHGTLHAETAIGGVSIFLGLGFIFAPGIRSRKTLSLVIIAAAALAIIFPTAITGVCGIPSMSCRHGTVPFLVTVGIIMGAAGVAGLFIRSRE